MPQTPPVPVTGMDIPHDDEDIVVVDKPIGIAVHADPDWNGSITLGNLEAAGYQITGYGPPERRGTVYRLDVGTSGAMMVTKSEPACPMMKRTFKERTVTRIHHAVVADHVNPSSGTIETPIGCHPSREQ